jgi:hypothetical protein
VAPFQAGRSGSPTGAVCNAGNDARSGTAPAPASSPVPVPQRKYRRSTKTLGPRWWRTRADPFADVWKEIVARLVAEPARTATSLFTELQQRDPERFTDGQCRTLQRRVQEWLARSMVAFDEQ